MVPSGAPPPIGGAQQSLLRSTSSLLGGAAAQPSPRNQYGALGGIPTLLNHSFAGNGGPGAAEPDPLSFPSSSGLSQGQHFPVKMEQPGGGGEPNGLSLQQQYGFRGGGVKIEQPQSMGGLGPVKMESQGADQSQSVFMQQQRHQQHMLQLRQNSQAAATTQLNLLQQQQILHMQQQQQQMMKNLPQQRNQLPPPSQQQQQQQMNQMNQSGLAGRAQAKPNPYEPGTCARRLTQYMNHQQQRPEDNNIEFWRNFVGMYFAPNARKRWCVSLYGSGRQTTGVFPQDVWHCEICNRKPGRGFETTVEVLPRLCQIKYASGTLEELLYVDMPREYQNASGQIILDYAKAIQESVFDQLRVVRDGQLRIVFNPDLKISSWEFCARRHEELIPRRLLIPQVSQLGAVVQKHQAAGQNSSSSLSTQDLQNTCNSFVTTARQLAKALEVPLVNDLGYTKRYVRCLQISEVVNSMKDLIDYSRETGTGPIDSLINFPRRSSASSGVRTQQPQQQDGQQLMSPNANQNDHNAVHAAMQLPAASNGIGSVNNPTVSSITTSTTTAVGLHQNSMNSRQDNQMSAVNSSYGVGNSAQIPSASSSSSLPTQHPNPSSPFSSPTMSASNNHPASNFHSGNQLTSTDTQANMSPLQQTTQSQEVDTNDSVHQFLQNIMASQMNGASSLGNEMKGINGVAPVLNGANCLVGNGMGANSTNSSIGGIGFSSMGALGQPATLNGMRGAIQNNAMAMSGRAAMNPMSQDPAAMSHQQQHNMGNRLLGGFGASNSYNNLQFDWKPSP